MNKTRRSGIFAVICPVVMALVLLALANVRADGVPHTPNEVRALWVTRMTLSSPDKIAQLVRAVQNAGFNTLIVQVRGRGDAFYRSAIEPRATELVARPDFDPLAEVLARARPAGLSVHAWINANLVSSAAALPASRQHVIYRHPEWLMVPRDLATEIGTIDPRNPEYLGRLTRWTRARLSEVEGLYTSPLHPAAAAHVASVAADIVSNYAVDGVHLDYARFPNADFDYSRAAIGQFKQSLAPHLSVSDRRRADAQEVVDPIAYASLFPERWLSFRQARVTSLVMRVRTAVKAVNPNLVLSAAIGPDQAVAASSRMQDWRTWLGQSLVDALCPMAYTQDVELFARQISAARELAGDLPVWAGVGAYRLSPAATLRHIEAARDARAAGVVLFSYDALVSAPNSTTSLAALGRAAFGAARSR
jgi:uncharacterized lipoprotein YddW (UPF0748 family)